MNLSIPVQDDLYKDLPSVVKRHSYIEYQKYLEVVANVIQLLKNYKHGDIQKNSAHTGFKIRTLYKLSDDLKKNPKFNPLEKKCGQHHGIYTDE